jgi:hypothetical protein
MLPNAVGGHISKKLVLQRSKGQFSQFYDICIEYLLSCLKIILDQLNSLANYA